MRAPGPLDDRIELSITDRIAVLTGQGLMTPGLLSSCPLREQGSPDECVRKSLLSG